MDVKQQLTNVAKYLAHGALFSILTYVVGLAWGYLLLTLALTGALLGIVLAYAALMIAWGILNSLIAKLLWFPVDKGWRVWLGQGLALILSLGVLGIPLLIAMPYMTRLPYDQYVILLVLVEVLYAFLDGLIAMHVALHWKKRGIGVQVAAEVTWTPEEELQPDNPRSLHCPRCGSTKMIVAKDNSAFCLNCNRGVRRERLGGTSS